MYFQYIAALHEFAKKQIVFSSLFSYIMLSLTYILFMIIMSLNYKAYKKFTKDFI